MVTVVDWGQITIEHPSRRVVLPNSVAGREKGVKWGVNNSHLSYLENGGWWKRKLRWYTVRGGAPSTTPPIVSFPPRDFAEFSIATDHTWALGGDAEAGVGRALASTS